jgi:hypothetical protein
MGCGQWRNSGAGGSSLRDQFEALRQQWRDSFSLDEARLEGGDGDGAPRSL